MEVVQCEHYQFAERLVVVLLKYVVGLLQQLLRQLHQLPTINDNATTVDSRLRPRRSVLPRGESL